MNNIFEELLAKKENLIAKVNKAKDFGWIDQARCDEIVEKINSDVLTIGVIGQMKCGKSTFLNSFVFEDEILPSATTPMTAALSVITYGEEKKIVAEFYNEEEWAEMKIQASRDLEEVKGNSLLESKIKAAKELVEKSGKLGPSISSYLLKGKQEDSFENLIEYVGADGKFVAITKSVMIYYPKECLKGVEIVDTPGFNDPIVSREERTNEFLKKADVVIMMLYAGRPFDATDRDIIFTNVRQCGIGKVIIGINKYDIPYENGESEDEIKEYVKQELKKACRDCDDYSLVEILESTEPIPISAEMALLAELPMSTINTEEHLSFSWKRSCDTFEISNQKEMRQKSHIAELTDAIQNLLEKEKDEILFRKPINAINSAGNQKKSSIENDLLETELLVQDLSKPDTELEDALENRGKAKKRLERKIDSLDDDLNEQFRNQMRSGRNNLEDILDAACNRMETIIKNSSKFKSLDVIKPDIEKEKQRLLTRDFKRAVDEIAQTVERNTKNAVQDFMTDAEEVLMKYLPDIDSDAVVSRIKAKVINDIEDRGVFEYEEALVEKNKAFSAIENGLTMFLGGAVGIGIKEGLKAGYHAISHEKKVQEMLQNLLTVRNMDLQPFLNSAFISKDAIIQSVKRSFIAELVEPLEKKVEEILADTQGRENKRIEAETHLSELKDCLVTINKQIAELA